MKSAKQSGDSKVQSKKMKKKRKKRVDHDDQKQSHSDSIGSRSSRQSEVESIRMWMTEQVQLKQYFAVFIQNGYDCIEMVLDMKREHLAEIGIVDEQHQTKIIALSPLLNGSNGANVVNVIKEKDSKGNGSSKTPNEAVTRKVLRVNMRRPDKRRMDQDEDDEKTETDMPHPMGSTDKQHVFVHE